MVKLIRVIQQVLVKNIFYSKSNKAFKLTFITVFSIKIVITYLPTLAPVGVVNKI